MSGIVWLASYPKSGNTWLRALLTNALSGQDRPASINRLLGHPMAASRKLFDDWSGVRSADLTSDEIANARPRVYEAFARHTQGPVFSKVHDAFALTPSGEMLFPRSATAAVIYIVRHPADVALSYAHHRGITPAQAEALLQDDGHSLAADGAVGVEGQLPQKLSSWSQHVAGWLDSPLPLHLVRYEDLHRDAHGTLSAVLRFLGLDQAEAVIERAVRFSRFSELREQESAHGFFEAPSSSRAFFRAGLSEQAEGLHKFSRPTKPFAQRRILRRCGYQG